MSRQEFPKSVKVARLRHAMKNGVIYCEGCGCPVKPGEFDFDHDNADGLTGKPTFENCRVLCTAVCHPKKTKDDTRKIAQAKRREAAHVGLRKAPKLQSRNDLPKSEKRPKIVKTPVVAKAGFSGCFRVAK